MANISNDELTKIRNSVNIVDIIGNYINLEKKGKNYFGLCPFHDDHSPSMSVSEEKQIYTCFVCGKSGNVFTFIRDFENISFIEAVGKVASISGISIDTSIKFVKKYEKEYEIYDYAIKYYKNNLNSELGVSALKYLKNRNIDEKIISNFDIGLSLNDNNLTKILSKKYDSNILEDIGLCNKKETLYDLFRNRIMFPIHDSNGNPVGFSARIYNNETDSKYINTKETYIFKKGEILFNYHRAVNEAKKNKYIIICEGQMDAIRIYSNGIKNVIATMGTALTRDHIKLIKKLNVPVILNMDSDQAGKKAAIQNGDLLANNNIIVKVLTLVGAKDPDEFIIKYGIDKYKDAIKHSINLFDFKLNELKSNKNLNSSNELTSYINDVIIELNKSDDELLRNITINKLSEEYKIDKKILENRLVPLNKKEIKVITKKVNKQKERSHIRAIEEILYYMMNSVNYSKIFEIELNYIPEHNYFNIEKEIQAYILINKTINIADFISYMQKKEDDSTLLNEIINNHNDIIEMNETEFINYINIIKKWIQEDKIKKLKIEQKQVTDINKKKEIIDMITKIKRGSENYGK